MHWLSRRRTSFSGVIQSCNWRSVMIQPGATYSELTTPMYTEAVKKSLFERVPMKEIAQPEWIARGIVFLASAWLKSAAMNLFVVQVGDYGLQLREKQRLRRIYGVLEAQFRRYYGLALSSRGQTGANLITIDVLHGHVGQYRDAFTLA